DLDSESELVLNAWYNVTALYSGADMELYLNGNLDAFTSWSGTILPTPIDLTIGQVLPGNQGYNFQGTLDNVRIYDFALSVQEIENLATGVTGVGEPATPGLPSRLVLNQNYPNPFNPATSFNFGIPDRGLVALRVFDVLGRSVATIVDEILSPGWYTRAWSAGSLPSGVYWCRLSTHSG